MIRVRTTALIASAGLGLSLAVGPADARPTSAPSAAGASALAAKSVPGGRIRIVLKGKRLGKKAKVVVRGIKGKAKGWKATVRVKKRKTVKKVRKKGRSAKPLPTGRYRVVGRKIEKSGTVARAKKKRKVKVTAKRGAKAVLRYTANEPSQDDPPPSDEPTPQPSPTATDNAPPDDTTAPGPVTGLKTGKITGTTIKLEWVRPVDADLEQIIVRHARGATPPSGPTDGTGVDLSFPTADFTTHEGLDPDTQHSYAVFARDDAGNTSGPAVLTTSTEPREILAQAIFRTATDVEIPTARVVDEDTPGTPGYGTISIDDVVLLGDVATDFTASTPQKLLGGPLRVVEGLTQTAEVCSLRHDGDPANIMTFSVAGTAETWSDKGSDSSELIDNLSGTGSDVIGLTPGSPTKPGSLVVDLTRTSSTDDPFLDVQPNCFSE